MNILERLWFKAKTGADIRESNGGKPVESVVIRFKEYYIEILLDAETGEPCDWGWSENPTMSHVPVREHYIARQEAKS